MTSDPKSTVRCAIYTRKSSEEGLEQSFNSLDAQREACQAFIISQRQEGWRLISARYDDGGFSGGNMERPALKRLLEDIESHKVDTIVVYKVDRLTRSLADFAKIVEALDARGVSFVSVTQQFNTTSSMGRLTLNVLLSFAQFEREVTGERIRDKIAASKRKGMWMGGRVPLGYELRDRKLIVEPEEAKVVNRIFESYLKQGCVAKLKVSLDLQQVRSKVRINASGIKTGGMSYSRGALYQILSNHIYVGEVAHRENIYAGHHDAIIPRHLWDKVQAQLKSNMQGTRQRPNARSESLLLGLLYDSDGNRLTPSHTIKKGKRYRYYISRSGASRQPSGSARPLRIPAHDIEVQVVSALRTFLLSEIDVVNELAVPGDKAKTLERLLASAKDLASKGFALPSKVKDTVRSLVQRVLIHGDSLEVLVSKPELRELLLQEAQSEHSESVHFPEAFLHIRIQATIKRCGKEVRLVIHGAENEFSNHHHNSSMIKAIARGHNWYEQIIKGSASGRRSISQATGMDERYVSRILQAAFLAPDITEAILAGRQPATLTSEFLRKPLPLDWAEQRKLLGFHRRNNQE